MTEASGRAVSGYIELTADITSAFVSNNTVEPSALPTLIKEVFGALSTAGDPRVEEPTKREPAVAIKKSVHPDWLISLIDGKKYKSLKRHLRTQGFTPETYRAEFGLASDYPMVSANYSAQRSSLAKNLGLGRGGRGSTETPTGKEAAVAETIAPPAKAKRGRKVEEKIAA